jgi:hypothetical protein
MTDPTALPPSPVSPAPAFDPVPLLVRELGLPAAGTPRSPSSGGGGTPAVHRPLPEGRSPAASTRSRSDHRGADPNPASRGAADRGPRPIAEQGKLTPELERKIRA